MTYKLVFIDDQMSEKQKEPFVRTIWKLQPDAEVFVFLDPQEGLDFILDNLNNQMIVFLDCRFDEYPLQGINVLKKIREKTSLLYVVMMSANPITHISGTDLADMINEEYICFFDKSKGAMLAVELIDRIKSLWDSRFDCVLEAWLIRHPEDNNKEAYSSTEKVYTWNDILDELRKQTHTGKLFEKKINEYYIHTLNRSHK